MEQCKQCGTNFEGEFCPQCGQRKYIRINGRYVINEFTDSILKMNRGLLFTLKGLLTLPGKVARDYIDGKRQMHARPFRLAVFLTVIAAFIAFKVINIGDIMLESVNYKEAMESAEDNSGLEAIKSFFSFYYNYSSVVLLLLIPGYALITKIAFYGWGQNYYEHLILNAFYFSFTTIIQIILLDSLVFIFRNQPETALLFSQLSLLFVPLWLFWFFKTFYFEKSIAEVILRILAMIGLIFVLIFIIIIIGVLAVIAYFIIMGVD